MIPVPEAIDIVKKEVGAPVAERVPISEAAGRILSEDILADSDLPPFNRSQMDGFAMRHDDDSESLRIIGESVAGRGFDGKVAPGTAVRIMTGARVPEGADAVQKVESTEESDGIVTMLEAPEAGQNIVKSGEEVRKGHRVMTRGEIIGDNAIATLASFGYSTVEVGVRPKVSILSTGSEIVSISETPAKDQIRNSNSELLRALVSRTGGEALIRPHADDDLEQLKSAISDALGDGPDILIITGGVSVGDYDFTKPALRELGAEIFFEKVSLKPGKPTVFARLGETLIFGLPGNPVSVAVTFHLFVRTAILAMQGAIECGLREGFAVASKDFKGAKERDCYLPVSLGSDLQGHLVIEAQRFGGSSNFIAFSKADALLFIPKGGRLEQDGIGRIYFLR